MRRNIFIALTILLLGTASVQAQDQTYVPTPVTISKEKVRFGDKVYWSHVVLERQTLYSICKAYGVTLEQVYEANPDLNLQTEGLKKNSILRIPVVDSKEAKATAAATTNITHTVKWYEDLEAISIKYGVSKEDIKKANNLTDDKLKPKQKLVIPVSADKAGCFEPEPEPEPAEPTESTVAQPDGTTVETEPVEEPRREAPIAKTDLSMALILPINATGNASSNYLDFYSGALLAARDAKDEGVSVDLSVYDDAVTLPAFTSERLGSFDAIIGPVGKTDMTAILAKAPASATVVSPLDPKTGALTATHSNLYQANADSKDQYGDLVKWIGEDMKHGDKVLVISEKSKVSVRNTLDSLLTANGIAFSSFSYNILEGRNIVYSMMSSMSSGAVNRVLIASESEAFVNDVVRNLNLAQHNGHSVVLYGPSKFKTFDTIDIENYHNVNLHMSLSYNIDYDDARVKAFIMKYRAIFGTEPNAFAFQGYDLVKYFADSCSRFGNDWITYTEGRTENMLQSSIRFEKTSAEGGYSNKALRRVVYEPDCRIEIVK